MGHASEQIWNKRLLPSIRTRLALLVLACMVPAAMGLVLLTENFYGRERAQFERDTLLMARALALVVDRDLEGAKMAALALATSPSLTKNNLSAFYSQATSLLNDEFPGFTFVLSDQTGQQLVNTIRPFGQELPYHGNLDQLRQVFETGKSVVSDVYIGGVLRQPLIGIDVPVWRDGAVAYDLSVGILPERIGKILTEEQVPAGRIVAIFDTKGIIVARSHDPKNFIGQKGAPEILERMRETHEGALDMISVEGIPVYSIFSRSPVSGWTVAIGIQKSTIHAELLQTVARLSVVIVALLGFGSTLAWRHGLAISRTIKALSSSATAMGASGSVQTVPMSFREAEEVAAELLRHRRNLEHLIDERTQQLGTSKALLTQLTAANETLQVEIIERKRAEETLRQSESRYRMLHESLRDAFVQVNMDGLIIYFNDIYCQMTGYSPEEIRALTYQEITPDYWHEIESTIVRDQILARGYSDIYEKEYRRKDGTIIPVEMRAILARDAAGQPNSMWSLIRDITERKRAEEKIKASLAEKEVMLKEIHHRVKNNLQVISSLVSLQAENLTDDRVRDELNDVRDRVRSMALIHEKLYQASGLAQLNFADYTAGLLRGLWNSHGTLAAKVRLNLTLAPVTLSIETAIPCGLILNELAGNALKHAFPNSSGGEVTVSLEHDLATDTVCLRVRDNGVGLPVGLDWRQSPSLGLRLVQILTSQLRGTVETGTGSGVEFKVTFPLSTYLEQHLHIDR